MVSSDKVPLRIREALSVESGLNDGLALPYGAVARVFLPECRTVLTQHRVGWHLVLRKLLWRVGRCCSWFLWRVGDATVDSARLAWGSMAGNRSSGPGRNAWAAAESIHGNGFIAAFVGGLIFGERLCRPAKFLFEFSETEGQMLVLGTFALFGAILLPTALAQISWPVVIYALLSLTLVRMVPVFLSLGGVRLQLSTRLFLGWFGPRGLASILFALLIAEETMIVHIETLTTVVFVTVLFSVLLHGVSAGPLSNWYSRHISASEGTDSAASTATAEQH